ncbi:MAG TPA: serine/threonine-protein kinase [Kofleriaceae bacterium]|nr:serine/threonine-protein kinase [Kofleriaceae bacterium]
MMRADADANDRTTVERHDPMIGAVLDRRFRIDFQLATGGFGAIYRATDVLSDAEVALKVLHPQLTRDPSVVARFRREGAALSSLRDPHTITAYEIGEADDGTLYIVMELLRGESLYQRFRTDGPLPWRRVVHIARGVCSSLAEAHAAGIVHRDLKPANIHLETRDGDPDFAKVLDFGIAKIIQGNEYDRSELTQAGTMIGTVDYMSPEQMVGGELAPSSDVYTLGVVIYEMITGHTPFADNAQSATSILAALLTRTPEPMSSYADVPAALEQIVMRCLERNPDHRYGDITELADALAAVAGSGAHRPRREVPTSGFEETVLTSEATRIDVRYTESSQPVLDARGPRVRPGDVLSPLPGPVPVPSSPRMSPARGAAPARLPSALPVATPPGGPAFGARHAAHGGDARDARYQPLPPLAVASPQPFPPPAPAAPPTPAPGAPSVARGVQPVIDLAAWHREQLAFGGSLPVVPGAPGAPGVRAPGHAPPTFDMTAVATRDAMVRRIIWAILVVLAVIAIVVAMRLAH